MKIQYHAVFVDDVNSLQRMFPPVFSNLYYHHSTIEFAPKDTSNIQTGRKVKLNITGRLTTDKLDVLLVSNSNLNSKNLHPHITLSTAEGVKPFESNKALETYWNIIAWFETPIQIETTEGYFNGRDVIRP